MTKKVNYLTQNYQKYQFLFSIISLDCGLYNIKKKIIFIIQHYSYLLEKFL